MMTMTMTDACPLVVVVEETTEIPKRNFGQQHEVRMVKFPNRVVVVQLVETI